MVLESGRADFSVLAKLFWLVLKGPKKHFSDKSSIQFLENQVEFAWSLYILVVAIDFNLLKAI